MHSLSSKERKENGGSHQCLHWQQQMSTGHLHENGFKSLCNITKKTQIPVWESVFFGGVRGI